MWPADDHSELERRPLRSQPTDYWKPSSKDWSAIPIKAKGATPIIVAPYTRQTGGVPQAGGGLRGYPEAAEKAAKDSDTAFLNLTAISTDVLNALGPTTGNAAYVDGQHTKSYGAYMNSRSVAFGIIQLKLDLAQYLVTTKPPPSTPKNHYRCWPDWTVPLEAGPPGRGGGGPGRRGAAPGTGPATAPARGNTLKVSLVGGTRLDGRFRILTCRGNRDIWIRPFGN